MITFIRFCKQVKEAYGKEFPDKQSCLKAERECLQELDCGVLSREEMPDGYTETTDASNLVKIENIYRRNGGLMQSFYLKAIYDVDRVIEKLTEEEMKKCLK